MNKIDELLILVTKHTGGQLPRGIFTDISRILGISKQRVEQRSKKLNLIPYKNNHSKVCMYCSSEFKPNHVNQRFCTRDCGYRYSIEVTLVKTHKALKKQFPKPFGVKNFMEATGHKTVNSACVRIQRLTMDGIVERCGYFLTEKNRYRHALYRVTKSL